MKKINIDMDSGIVEEKISLNIVGGKSSENTSLINGELLAFVVVCDELIDVEILMADFDICVFETKNFVGSNYFGIKNRPFNEKAEVTNFQGDHYFLNDVLKVSVRGISGAHVDVFVRYRNG